MIFCALLEFPRSQIDYYKTLDINTNNVRKEEFLELTLAK